MKHYLIISSLFLFSAACNNAGEESKKSENDIDAARNFIRAALDGKFNDARTFLYRDSANNEYIDAAERSYQRMDPGVKQNYHEASINIHNVTPVNDSTTIVIYSNSYKNDHDTLKILRTHDQWLVDLKYLFLHDQDTTHPFDKNKGPK